MTAAKPPTPLQVERALATIARAFGPGWVPDLAGATPAHVEFPPFNGGPVDTFRVWAADGDRRLLLAQVPRAALRGGQ